MTTIPVDHEVLLRPPSLDDAVPLFEIIDRDRDYLGEFLPWTETTLAAKDTETFLKTAIDERAADPRERFLFMIEFLGDLAGLIDIRPGSNPASSLSDGMIGYWLAEPMQGRGIMTRSCRAVVEHGFSAMRLSRITIHADVTNQPSRAIPKRLGFTYRGIESRLMPVWNRHVDMARYDMAASDWVSKQGFSGSERFVLHEVTARCSRTR